MISWKGQGEGRDREQVERGRVGSGREREVVRE